MGRESYSRLHPPPNLNVDKVECKVSSWASDQKTTTLKFGVRGEVDRACIGKTCKKTSDIDSRLKNSTLGRQERSKSLRCKILTGILLGPFCPSSHARGVRAFAEGGCGRGWVPCSSGWTLPHVALGAGGCGPLLRVGGHGPNTKLQETTLSPKKRTVASGCL